MATYQLSYGFNPDGTKNENPLKFDDDEEELEEARRKEEEEKKKLQEKVKQTKKKPSTYIRHYMIINFHLTVYDSSEDTYCREGYEVLYLFVFVTLLHITSLLHFPSLV